MKYFAVLTILFIILGCSDGTNKPDNSLSPIEGTWETACLYLGAGSDQSTMHSIYMAGAVHTLKSSTYSLSTCEGEVITTYEKVDSIKKTSNILVQGHEGICLLTEDQEVIVYHTDSDYLYRTHRLVPDVEGYIVSDVDCDNFDDSDFEIIFDNPYVKLDLT